jgi:hypothetical protein
LRTRTLLLLAIGCGLVILAAGVAQLLRIAAEDEPATAAEVGQPVTIGDLTITVEDVVETIDIVTATVEIGGVDDADGTDAFRLVVPGDALEPRASGGSGAAEGGAGADPPPCAGTTVTMQRCTLSFALPADSGTSRVLLYRRGDEQVRWQLAPA